MSSDLGAHYTHTHTHPDTQSQTNIITSHRHTRRTRTRTFALARQQATACVHINPILTHVSLKYTESTRRRRNICIVNTRSTSALLNAPAPIVFGICVCMYVIYGELNNATKQPPSSSKLLLPLLLRLLQLPHYYRVSAYYLCL